MAWGTTNCDGIDPSGLMREFTLRLCDMTLLQGAAHYDLNQKTERQRSARDLAKLFFRLNHVLDPDLFIEAGAKDGSSSRRARRYLEEARIVAFEANPYTYKAFRGLHGPKSGVEYHHLALSDQSGPITFHVRQDDDGSPRPDGHGSLMERDESYPHTFTKVEVEAVTLDEFFAGYEFGSSALWIDVEGAARRVLLGGKEILSKACVAIIEVEDSRYWKDAWSRSELMEFFYSMGMIPIARDYEYRHQYNLVFLRAELLDHPMVRHRLTQHLSSCSWGGRSSEAGVSDDSPTVWGRLSHLLPKLGSASKESIESSR